jgi:hypothetical protein
MKNQYWMRRSGALTLAVLAGVLAGCAAPKEKPAVQRGWVGGEYRMARVPKPAMPNGATNTIAAPESAAVAAPKSGLLVAVLQTNAPAGLAGLREGDFIVAVNDQPVSSLKGFVRAVDESKPGSWIKVKVWRAGGYVESRICVGRETFRKGGVLTIEFPTVVRDWDFWYPDSWRGGRPWSRGLSLVFAGYQVQTGRRAQLPSAKPAHDVFTSDWSAWLVFFDVSKGKRIMSQESVPPQATWMRQEPAAETAGL